MLLPFRLAMFSVAVVHGAGQGSDNAAAVFTSARAQTEPKTRIAALQGFLARFPSSAEGPAAEDLLLHTYLNAFPEQSADLHRLAGAQITSARPGYERWMEEIRLARLFAEAGPKGADLPDAAAWAQDAATHLTEAAYRVQMSALRARYKLPALTPAQLHAQGRQDRAAALAALAAVDLRQGRLPQAASVLAEATHLEPLSAEVNTLAAQLALAQNRSADALVALERADALGPLPQPLRDAEWQLFQHGEHGDRAALDSRVDDLYRSLYPPLFTLPKRPAPPGGHPVLLELFTGSDCPPCAGPDLALDSLLASYPSTDLVALEFDEHIPSPDPLANPDSVARAAFYGVETTPSAFLDGAPLEILGSTRNNVENIVVAFADALENQAAMPSGLDLSLSIAGSARAGDITAQLSLQRKPSAAGGTPSLQALSRAVLFVALVEDNVRFPGSNGVRLHRVVVRSLQQAPAAAFLAPRQTPQTFTFNPGSLNRDHVAYLTDYETHNDRFGAFDFRSKDLPIDGDHLAFAAWVQDPVTRRVLQAAFLAAPPN